MFIRHLLWVFFPGKSDKDQLKTSHSLDLVSAALDKTWRDFVVLHTGEEYFQKKHFLLKFRIKATIVWRNLGTHLIWILLSERQINWEISLNFWGLLRKLELYSGHVNFWDVSSFVLVCTITRKTSYKAKFVLVYNFKWYHLPAVLMNLAVWLLTS